tara:strand:+ start:21199 stop:21387 length:189 start_codon:yes stop_codon:yes gene_type:complete
MELLKQYSLYAEDETTAYLWLSDVLELCGMGRKTMEELELLYDLNKKESLIGSLSNFDFNRR